MLANLIFLKLVLKKNILTKSEQLIFYDDVIIKAMKSSYSYLEIDKNKKANATLAYHHIKKSKFKR